MWGKSKKNDFVNDNGDDMGFDYSDPVEVPEPALDDYEDEIFDLSYEDIFDAEGGPVICPRCGADFKLKDRKRYMCANCGEEMTREEFMNYIGIDPVESPDDYDDYYRYP